MSHKKAKIERQMIKGVAHKLSDEIISKLNVPRNHKLFWGSSYDRGLIHLLKMWPKIREAYPDAELHICYGWETFLDFFRDNPERMMWYDRMNKEITQPGIVHHGRVGKEDLKRIRQDCGIWAYPTHFTEINCMTALESQQDGCVPVVINLAALKETVQSGVKVEGDIYEPEVQAEYLKQLLALMGDQDRWQRESLRGQGFVTSLNWQNLAGEWTNDF